MQSGKNKSLKRVVNNQAETRTRVSSEEEADAIVTPGQ